MRRVISSLRLLGPRSYAPGPLEPSADSELDPRDIGDFLDALYIAIEKMRAFGLKDHHFGGKIRLETRKKGEKANGRYFPKKDESVLYHPPLHGPPDWPWTIVHELMHRVWSKHIPKESQELWNLFCDSTGKEINGQEAEALTKAVQNKPERVSLWLFFKKAYGGNLELFQHWLKTRRLSDSFPSQYASAEPSEAFAEVAANMILGRGHTGREINRTGSMPRKIFLNVINPLRRREGSIFEDVQLEQMDENFLQLQVDFGYLRVMIPRWVAKNIRPDELLKLEHRPHATVYYGADKRDLPQIEKIVEDYGRPIRLMIGSFNVFEHDDKDVLYLEMIGPALKELHDKIAELPHSRPPTHPEYKPHLTVAYLEKGAGRRYVGSTPFRNVISARGITVIDSNGIEKTIRSVPNPALEREPLLMAGR